LKPIHPESIRRLLIRGTNWVGDAVMSVPALKAIRRVFPNAGISLLVRPWVRDVYAAAPFVDEILSYDKLERHSGWMGRRLLISELRARRFDMAILLQNAMEAAWIAYWARIPLRLGYRRDGRAILLTHAVRIDPAVRKVHQVYYYLGLLSGAGLLDDRPWESEPCRAVSIAVPVSASDQEAARAMLLDHGITADRPVVGLNPGASYGGAKRWPAERFAALADALAERCMAQIVIFGAPSERPVAERVAAQMASPPAVLAGRTTLGHLMGLIRECDLFITNDSGPMHLAAALDVPQLAIFGSTSEIATGPLSSRATVVRKAADCSPCFLRECPTDFRCMLGITVGEILNAAEGMLRGKCGGESK